MQDSTGFFMSARAEQVGARHAILPDLVLWNQRTTLSRTFHARIYYYYLSDLKIPHTIYHVIMLQN